MAEDNTVQLARPLVGKILVRGLIRLQSGLRIGGGKGGIGIGDLDNPVIREGLNQEPYVPGSSLKGKLRALLERKVVKAERARRPNAFVSRPIGTGVYIHVCKNTDDAKDCPVCRLFGSSGEGDRDNQGKNFPSRLKIRDAFLTPGSLKKLTEADTGSLYTEIKNENAVDRITAAANPRQVERVPAGSDFDFEMVYDVEEMMGRNWQKDAREDLENLYQALRLLEDDALGGYGSRGYGQVLITPSRVVGKKADYYLTGSEQAVKTIPEKEQTPADSLSLPTLNDTFKEILAFFGS